MKTYVVYTTESLIMKYTVYDCDSADEARDAVLSGEVEGKCISCEAEIYHTEVRDE